MYLETGMSILHSCSDVYGGFSWYLVLACLLATSTYGDCDEQLLRAPFSDPGGGGVE